MIPSVFPMLVGPATGSNTATALAGGASAFGSMQGFDPSQGVGAVPFSGSTSGQAPSTEDFLHVLDLFLSTSSLPQAGSTSISNLLVQTSVTTSSEETSKTSAKDSEDLSAPSLDPSLCAGIAALLQGMGFQVQPEQIRQLSPMDQQQLDSALEFASRNLQKGTDATQVAECAALLLPRPWPLDDRTGAPTSTATSVQGQETFTLPAGFVQSLDQVRSRLHDAVAATDAQAVPTGGNDAPTAAGDPTPAASLSNAGKASTTVLSSAVTASSAVSTDPRSTDPDSDPALQVLQGLQQSAAAKDSGAGLVASEAQARHIPPGGTASEFIGRQVLEKVQVQLSEGKRELSLRLWPEELGEVRLSLRMTEDDKVHAHMVVENDSVRQAMLDSMPQLRDALTRHGMDLEKMSVSVDQKDAGSADSGSGDTDGGGGKRSGRGGYRDEEIEVAVPLALGEDTGRRNGFNTIDIWS